MVKIINLIIMERPGSSGRERAKAVGIVRTRLIVTPAIV
jgi:hypothetical protein